MGGLVINHSRLRGLIGAAALLLHCFSHPAAEPSQMEKRILWDKTVNLRGALGYKDNVLLSAVRREESLFWMTSADLILFRLGDTPWNLTFFASAEDRRFFSAREIEKEQLLLAHVDVGRTFLENWKAGAEIEYYYLDQVVDASATELLFRSLPVKSHAVMATPYVSRDLPRETFVRFEYEARRQFFSEPLDDYWEHGPELTFGKRYGHRSEATIAWGFSHRPYDTRGHVRHDFEPIPGTSLDFYQHRFELGLNHSWDAGRKWRSRVRAAFEPTRDNGTGFFDYDKYRLAKRLSYFGDDWEASIEGKALVYLYRSQPVFLGDETRERRDYALTVRFQKRFAHGLAWFAETEHQWARSNFDLDQYSANTVMSGVDWEF